MHEVYRFQLSFKGQLVENSVDAFDVANTILATTLALQEIATIKLDRDTARDLKLNIGAFKEGSLVSEFVYHMAPLVAVAPTIIYHSAPQIIDVSRTVIDGLKTFIDVKKLLKGKRADSVRAVDGGQNVTITVGDNSSVTINYNDYRALQSQTLSRNVAKMTQPLRKEDSLLEEIDMIASPENSFQIKKDEANYFNNDDLLQTVSEVRYRGVISKIDSKVRSGYISVGSRRIPFTYPEDLAIEQFIILAESLKRQIQVILVGEVSMDFESNPRSISIASVESELQLF
jgi:hypothetical protein